MKALSVSTSEILKGVDIVRDVENGLPFFFQHSH